MDFGCNDFPNFIEKLYDFFTEIKICFLSGAIVFDNEHQWLYNSLMKGRRLDKNCENVFQRPAQRTHRAFFTQKDFKKERKELGARNDTFMIRDVKSPKQHDKHINPPLDYLCDKRCRTEPQPADCLDGNKETKGIAMFYPFTVTNGEKTVEYLFLKLEQYATKGFSEGVKHLGQLAKKKVGIKKKMTHKARREDDRHVPSFEHADKEAMLAYYIANGATLEEADILNQKIDFFNANLRVGNEVYIPSQIVEMIFRVKISPKAAFKKAAKNVMAAAKFLPFDGPGSDRWNRKEAAMIKQYKSSGRSAFGGVPCMEATYLDSKQRPTPYSKEQLFIIAKKLDLPVTTDMTKQQLCDYISLPLRRPHEKETLV